jgi:hypothetical protein
MALLCGGGIDLDRIRMLGRCRSDAMFIYLDLDLQAKPNHLALLMHYFLSAAVCSRLAFV